MKTTLLLATTLFLVSAPAPDSRDIAEMTSNFIILDETPGLQASEEDTNPNHDLALAASVTSAPEKTAVAAPSPKPEKAEPAKDAGPDRK